jgi:putative addiction module component (TIGR02574 family)
MRGRFECGDGVVRNDGRGVHADRFHIISGVLVFVLPVSFSRRLRLRETVRSKNDVAWRLGAPYTEIMTTEEVKALPVDEKIRMMEAIWEDFRERFDRMEIPQEQKDLLDQRRARVREGKARLLDWESVKGTIGR